MDANEKSGTAVKVDLDPDLLNRLESYRRSQPVIPSRAACLRQFLALGLASAQPRQHGR